MSTTLHHLSIPTPTTPLTVLLDGDTVVASGFGMPEQLLARMDDHATRAPAPTDHPVGTALRAWLAGDGAALDAVDVRQPGTSFQQEVWAALRAIPAGRTRTYGEVAAAVGRPGASRAVGSACARNRLAPFVPCHRVLPATGATGAYAWGADVKRWLLDTEAALST
ncbi:methylated-DNA--[protein]-cysteine S-methyltransferase [Euzebya rosea]|uniref:methylated-DNA--[protein]-cysteine S-methyltransferase n=1 Tax=Euzebya rosea TaxID=2052804 RepID=UPI001F0B8D93|nr:methylated-DNA--[protein]-cysteine S-methyltransferase [Euzebya rosea]